MSSAPTHDKHSLRILDAFESDHHVSQRSLARELGVALGLTNLLVRRLVAKGYVRLAGMGTRHVRYLMTPEGLEALGRATKASLENTLHLYTETREQIRAGLNLVSARCPADESGQKRVVFYGAGDVAEIAYISLQSTDLALVGVIDDQRKGRFFDLEYLRSWVSDGPGGWGDTIFTHRHNQLAARGFHPKESRVAACGRRKSF